MDPEEPSQRGARDIFSAPQKDHQWVPDDWYLTGDLGYMLNGEVFVSGRKKDLIIVGGKNVYPGDLERLAMEVKGVHPGRVVAFGIYNETTGTEEVVIVAEADETDIHSFPSRLRVAKPDDDLERDGRPDGQRHALPRLIWVIGSCGLWSARGAPRDAGVAGPVFRPLGVMGPPIAGRW